MKIVSKSPKIHQKASKWTQNHGKSIKSRGSWNYGFTGKKENLWIFYGDFFCIPLSFPRIRKRRIELLKEGFRSVLESSKSSKSSLQAPRGKSQGSKKRRVIISQVTGTLLWTPCTMILGPCTSCGVCVCPCECVCMPISGTLRDIAPIGWIYFVPKSYQEAANTCNFYGNTTQILRKKHQISRKAAKSSKSIKKSNSDTFEHI